MKLLSNPLFWWLFGVFAYPVVCAVNAFAWTAALKQLDWHFSDAPDMGWGAFLGFIIGGPLGIVSALSALAWQHRRFTLARCVAFFGSAPIGGFGVYLFYDLPSKGLVEEFCYIAPPLVWWACLTIFAFGARVPVSVKEPSL